MMALPISALQAEPPHRPEKMASVDTEERVLCSTGRALITTNSLFFTLAKADQADSYWPNSVDRQPPVVSYHLLSVTNQPPLWIARCYWLIAAWCCVSAVKRDSIFCQFHDRTCAA